MTKSAYDLNFCKQRLKWLFSDYMLPGPRMWLLLSPPEDERISISARLGSSYLPPALLGPLATKQTTVSEQQHAAWQSSRASLALRFQPDSHNPLSFIDVRTAVQAATATNVARLRACFFQPSLNVGAFAVASNIIHGGDAPVLGLRYR